jgi:hypothetical protein
VNLAIKLEKKNPHVWQDKLLEARALKSKNFTTTVAQSMSFKKISIAMLKRKRSPIHIAERLRCKNLLRFLYYQNPVIHKLLGLQKPNSLWVTAPLSFKCSNLTYNVCGGRLSVIGLRGLNIINEESLQRMIELTRV